MVVRDEKEFAGLCDDNILAAEAAPARPAACMLHNSDGIESNEKWEPQINFYEAGEVYAYEGSVSDNQDELQRRLGNRQIQLLAIGGSIGTALFVTINDGLYRAGPAGLFLAYTIYSCMVGLVNNCMAEMTTLYPVSGGFLRLAGHFVDDALGFMAGWNFFLYQALLIPFEITGLCFVLEYWHHEINPAAVIVPAIVVYAILNVLAVRVYGEAEFWFSGGKVILILMLFSFTCITMVGGNPSGDAYGFRYWKNPGAFSTLAGTGGHGRFIAFLHGLWSASFCVVGPEYVSMVAGEAKRPRVYIKNAFKAIYWRFGLFFIGGSLAVGILIAWNDQLLVDALSNTISNAHNAKASPYVIAMQNLGINGLPHVVNALLLTSVFSAGNTYTYCATRTLYGLALEGRAPEVLRYCTKRGVPVFCFAVVMVFPFLAFIQLGHGGASQALIKLSTLVTGGGVIDYIVMCVTYIFFHRACKAQGLDRSAFSYTGWFQPYSAYIALGWMIMVVFFHGYSDFKPFNTKDFFIDYTMLILAPILYVGWKVVKKTEVVKPDKVDLIWERPVIDRYEETFVDPPVGFWTEMAQLVGLRRIEGGNDRRMNGISA